MAPTVPHPLLHHVCLPQIQAAVLLAQHARQQVKRRHAEVCLNLIAEYVKRTRAAHLASCTESCYVSKTGSGCGAESYRRRLVAYKVEQSTNLMYLNVC